jgi:hypothetical protein
MEKKIFVGSIIAVAILVLVSITGVVGYSSVKSNSGKVSPLFSVRTNRLIGKETKEITSNFVNKDITLPFPKNDNWALLKKIIELANKGDDWAIKIEVKGDLLGYKVTLTNIGKETINGSLIMNITTDAWFNIMGRKLAFPHTYFCAEQLAPGKGMFRNLGPVLGFGPAIIAIDGVFHRVGMDTWDDCPVVPFGQEIKGLILLFFPLVNFKQLATPDITSSCEC